MNTQETIEQLGRSSRRAAIASAIGLSVVVVTLVYSAIRLHSLRREINAEEAEINRLDAEIASRKSVLVQLNLQIQISNNAFQKVSHYVPWKEAMEAVEEARNEIPNASRLDPFIAISFADEGQRLKAQEVASQLNNLGYEVTVDDEPRGIHISNNTYLRYFFGSDRDLALQIQGQIKTIGVDSKLQNFADEKDRGALGYLRPKAFEFWLGRSYRPPN